MVKAACRRETNRRLVRGSILFNGNVQAESDFVYASREALTSSRHADPAVAASRKVLLVTAGWCEREYQEAHIKASLQEIGIPSRGAGGYDTNLQNLSLYHCYHEFLAGNPRLAELWHEREELLESARRLYLEKNTFYTALLRRSLAQLQGRGLGRVLSDVTRDYSRPPADYDGDNLVGHFLANETHDTIGRLMANDDRMVDLLRNLDAQFVTGTGLHFDATWQRMRSDLAERILTSNSIFLFGGHLGVLCRCLSFFRLREALIEALRRGTCFYTVSAGSLACCERIIVYDDFSSDRREFQLFDRGFGLVRQLQLFPHCDDRIQTDDPDNLAYLAYRFQNRICVGLNQESYLLLESHRCTSVGHGDGVYVFDSAGNKRRYDYGQEISLTR